MPELPNDLALPIFLVVAAFLLGWYLVGNEIMRRRARRLALWAKRTLDPLGGQQSILWLTLHSFRLELEQPRAPLVHATITGLVESWDVPMNWLWNRLRGRRDVAMVQLTLRRPPIWGLELYRAGSLVGGDARHRARQEGWTEGTLEGFRLAPDEGAPRDLAQQLLRALGTERERLLRIAVRRQPSHLAVTMNVPDPGRLPPAEAERLLLELARVVARFATPTNGGQ